MSQFCTPASVHRAVLLLGPTGSGKTPLGERIERRGLWGVPCLHFDFGANLREAVDRDRPDALLTRQDLDFLRDMLQTGALLEDEQFPLAARILRWFLARRGANAQTVVVLNGLPRHVGQAEALEGYVHVRVVVHLACPGDVVFERIRANVGGDRTGREDDDLDAVLAKLAIYQRRTAPLLAHYRARGTTIAALEVTAAMTPDDAWQELESRGVDL